MSEETNIPINPEIDKALKEFEEKDTEQKQEKLKVLKTSSIPPKEELGIKFETDNWKKNVPSLVDDTPKMVQLVMKLSGGAIKDQRQAEYVLLGIVGVFLLISFYLFFSGGPSEEIINPSMPAAGPDDPNFIP